MAAIPGIWYASDAMGFTERPADAPVDYLRYVYSAIPDGRKFIVAKVWSGDDSDYDGTARLVAAAPDLLAALKQCLPLVDAYRRMSGGDGDVSAQLARFVIAQAEGVEE